MTLYLTAAELSELTGYRPNQFAAMARWLTRNGWPFAQDRQGLPRVLRSYHDARMKGAQQNETRGRLPNFDALPTS